MMDMTGMESIDDKYDMVGNTNSEEFSGKKDEEKRDLSTVRREDFLSIYKTDNGDDFDEEKPIDLSSGIKLSRDDDEEAGLGSLKTSKHSDTKPMIQELEASDPSTAASRQASAKAKQEPTIPFSWENSEVVELRTNFIQQADFVFLNVGFKGYQKDQDVRYAFSENEFVLEVRDRSVANGPGRKQRICQTLTQQIDVGQSEVQLLVDFISVKLTKLEKGKTWRSFGFDISEFAIPERTQMKSNFLKAKALPEPVKEDKEENNAEEEQKVEEEPEVEKTEEELRDEQ